MSNEIAQSPTKETRPQGTRQSWQRPRYEVKPGKDAYELRVHLPGVPRDQAEVTIEKDQLLVIGRRANLRPDGGKPVHQELVLNDFRLQLQLNVKIDTDQISARSEAGVLTVSLPVAEESKPRTIAVE